MGIEAAIANIVVTETTIANIVTYQLLLLKLLPINCYCQHSYLSTAFANIVGIEAAIANIVTYQLLLPTLWLLKLLLPGVR